MSDLVGNPEDRFSRVEAQLKLDETRLNRRHFHLGTIKDECQCFLKLQRIKE